MPPKKRMKFADIFEGHKNWNDLPIELKTMCYDAMDKKTRIKMSSTCKEERANFSLKTVDVDLLRVYISSPKRPMFGAYNAKFLLFKMKVHYSNGKTVTKNVKNQSAYGTMEKVATLLRRVLTVGRIKTLVWTHKREEDVEDCIEEAIRQSAPFHIEKFWCNAHDQQMPAFILENCVTLEKFCLQGLGNTAEPFRRILATPQLANAKFIQSDIELIIGVDRPDSEFLKLIIEKDAKIGTRFITKTNFETVKREFGDRIIKEGEKELVLRTDNEQKNILVRRDGFCPVVFDVVDSKNPEIDEDLDHWEMYDEREDDYPFYRSRDED